MTTAPLWWVNDRRATSLSARGKVALETSASTVVSKLPRIYVPTERIIVNLVVTPAENVFSYGVEDSVPTGWVIADISDGGEFDLVNRKVKWVFLDRNSRTLMYTAQPPAGAKGVASFMGLASFDGVDVAVAGSRELQPSSKLGRVASPQDGGVQVSLRGMVGATYVIEASDDLLSWIAVGELTNVNGEAVFMDSAAAGLARRFYRARKVE